MTGYNENEQEAIILNAMWAMINEMLVKTERTADVVLMFSTSTHMRLFNVLLVDILSQPQPRQGGSVPFDLPILVICVQVGRKSSSSGSYVPMARRESKFV